MRHSAVPFKSDDTALKPCVIRVIWDSRLSWLDETRAVRARPVHDLARSGTRCSPHVSIAKIATILELEQPLFLIHLGTPP